MFPEPVQPAVLNERVEIQWLFSDDPFGAKPKVNVRAMLRPASRVSTSPGAGTEVFVEAGLTPRML